MIRSTRSRSDEATAAVVRDVRIEHQRDLIGIGDPSPRVSWTVVPPFDAWRQAAYELIVSDPLAGTGTRSGRILGRDSVLTPWPFAPLPSRARRVVRLRVWGDHDDAPSPWSAETSFETGLLDPDDWTATLIEPDWVEDTSVDQPPVFLRRVFGLRERPVSGRLYVTAHGVYEISINGTRVGDDILAPGWSSYRDRLRYRAFDVGDLLKAGANVIGAVVADGWFRGRLGFRGGRRNIYGQHVGLLAQLEVGFSDGSILHVGTDATWRAGRGPIRAASLYDGETYDARLELAGWTEADYDDAPWSPVREVRLDRRRLVAPTGPPIRRTANVRPVAVTRSTSGALIIDFGQVLVGRLRIRPQGPRGTVITIRHAEVLERGELCVRPLRGARSTDRFIIAGTGAPESWEPSFTVHGFRFAEVGGWPGDPGDGDIEAVVIHSDLERRGGFACSDPDVSRLHENVVWSLRGNLVDVPTDCPQRDERLGWTGDLQVIAPAAAFVFDIAGQIRSWLMDLAADQRRFGTVPAYVPWARFTFPAVPIAGWGDAAVIVPWVVWQRYGDRCVLEDQIESMLSWVEQVADLAPEGRWEGGIQFGDWLDPAAPPDRPGAARTDPALVATAYHARTARIVAEAADILGRSDDASRCRWLAARAREAFRREYVTTSGRVVGDTQTGYAIALRFGLLNAGPERERAVGRLVQLIREGDHRIGTGFLGTPLILDALSEAGQVDVAYHLLMQRRCPSWLYPVTMGATTVWERWDSILPDGSVNPGQMTSFNHYALGAVADWLHRVVGGLSPAEPGYRRIDIAPRPGGGLTSATTWHETPYGRASVAWTREEDRLQVVATVPPGTTGTVRLPDPTAATLSVGPGEHEFVCPVRPAMEDPSPPPLPDIHAAEVTA